MAAVSALLSEPAAVVVVKVAAALHMRWGGFDCGNFNITLSIFGITFSDGRCGLNNLTVAENENYHKTHMNLKLLLLKDVHRSLENPFNHFFNHF